jgi:uncharacterized protein involved in type VI secretion and phage assembly
VRLPWYDEGDTSFWARTAMPMAGNDRGTYFLPEVGDEVLVGAENGDPSHLYVLGMLWNGQHSPPTTNSDGKNNERLIRSRAGHVLRFVDDEANPEIELRLEDGKRLALDKDGAVLEDGKGNVIKIETSSGAIEVTAKQQLKLKATTVSIEASGSMDIKASGVLTLKGAVVQIN